MRASFHLPGADGIRGLACLWVLVVHNVAIIFPSTFPGLTGCGKIGVWLFFVLSAYLLTARFRISGVSVNSLVEYANGRFWRIIPPFVCAVVFYRVFGTADLDTWRKVVAALCFQTGPSHLWTIPVEFKFYLLLPAVVVILAWLHRQWGVLGCCLGGAALIVFHQWLYPFWSLPDNSIETRRYVGAFLFGAVGAFLPRSDRAWLATVTGCGILVVVIALMPITRELITGIPPTRYLMNKYLIFAPLWTLFIMTQAEGTGWVGRFLCSRPMRWLGQRSYSIYLYHWFFSIIAHLRFPNSYPALVGAMALAMAAGALMYHLVEIPSGYCRKRLSRWLEPCSAAEAAGA